MPLAPVNKVENSCIAMCYANEFVNLLRTEEGVIRKSLFNDNVRDFQGTNNVNREIEATVCDEPDKFGLLNNGITIVCDEFIPSNRRITLKNPQIVNGCQTSNVLFNAAIARYDISKIPLQIKIISTRDIEIINQIVRGTNRQNIVLDEAFETTRQFHKDLEEFFLVLSSKYGRIYYERRSRQYQNDPRIKQTEKVNLRIITQSFVGMYLNMPHMSHRHEAKLLKEYEDKLYQEHHSKLPYFTAALTFVKLESLFRKNKIDRRSFYSFRAHLMMLFREIIAGSLPNIDNEKSVDDNCEKILMILNDEQKTEDAFNKCVEVFGRAKNIWCNKMMKSVFGMKDIADFTFLLMKEAGNNAMINIASVPYENILSGRVIKVFIDRTGAYCGFIERNNGNLFFHSAMNQNLDFRKLKGEMVSYRLSTNRQRPVAIGVKRLR